MNYSYEEIMEYVNLYFTTGVRWVCMGLAVLVLLHQIFALLKMRNPSEIWAYLKCPDGSNVPLTHWENLVGRARGCDVILNLQGVSRSHGTLIRSSHGIWEYDDLNSKNGSFLNGKKVTSPTVIKGGDILSIGGADFQLYPLSMRERMEHMEQRKRNTKRTSPWLSMLAISAFQLLTVMQFRISLGDEFPAQLPIAFFLLCLLMWVYVILLRIMKRTGFEVEIIAFFLSTLSLAVTASAYPTTVLKQSLCVLLGVFFFFAMCWFLRDLTKAKKFTYVFLGLSVLLLILNLAIGSVVNGSQNWIQLGGFSIQPSEIVKIVFIFVGAASLDELQKRQNLLVFMGFSVFCLGCLAIMGDFGTAIIFFVTFLVISFLRSGDFTKLFLILGAAGLMGLMVLRFKPYVADRFSIWRHVWEDPTGAGYQQVQTMTSVASGGIPGLGAGGGNLSDVAASSTDLVFGLLAEEWGLVIAILAVLCIITLGVFAYRSIIAGRSTYYCIAACATTAMFMFQTILNVFGSIDLLPLTGVTFPFVSSGGTSMIVSWGMLAFLKAADTRQNASLAVRIHEKTDDTPVPLESMSAEELHDTGYFDFNLDEEMAGRRPDDFNFNLPEDDTSNSMFHKRSDKARKFEIKPPLVASAFLDKMKPSEKQPKAAKKQDSIPVTAPSRSDEGLASRSATPSRSDEGLASRSAAPSRSADVRASRSAAPSRSDERLASRSAAPSRSADVQASRSAAPSRSDERLASRSAAPSRSADMRASRSAAPSRSDERLASRSAAPSRSDERLASRSAAPSRSAGHSDGSRNHEIDIASYSPDRSQRLRSENSQRSQPQHSQRPQAEHPKAVKYSSFTDDDFFEKFETPIKQKRESEEESLTLDDIFGDDGIFDNSKKGGKR